MLSLLLIPLSYSITWENNATSLVGLGSTFQVGFGEEQYSAFYYNDSFYIGLAHPHSVSKYFNVGKYNTALTTREDGWDTIDNSNYGGSGFINYYNYTHGVAYSDNGQTTRKAYFFKLSDLTKTESWENTDNHPNSCSGTNGLDSGISIGSSGVIVSRHLDCTEKYYYPNGSTAYDLYIPVAYDDEIHDLSIIYDFNAGGGIPSYFLFYVYGSGSDRKGIYVSTYESNSLDSNSYLQTQTLRNPTDQSFNVSSISSVFNRDNNAYYLSYLINDTYGYGNSNDITDVKIIEYALQDNGDLVELSSQTFDPPNVDDSMNYTGSPHLFYVEDDDLDSFYMLYTIFNSSNDVYLGNWILKEETSCECSDWVNTTICVAKKVKQTRSCSPSDCAVESQYVTSTYCEKEFNKTQGIFYQESFSFSDSVSCDTGFVDPSIHGVIRCDVYLDIPIDCSNTKTNATTRLITIEQDSLLRTLDNNFTYDVCNPLTSCDTYTTYTCEEVYYDNITIQKGYDGYNGGDVATAGFQVTGSECASSQNFWGCEGWLGYRLIGSLTYTCDKNCGGYFCIKEGLIDFSVQQFIDCTYNQSTKIECTYGCNQASGLCFESMEESEGTEPGGKESPTNIFYYLDFLFAPDSASKKLVLAILGTVLFGSIAFSFGKPKEVIPIFFVFCGLALIFFIIIGYVPVILMIIVVFVTGLYFFLRHSGS